MGKLDKPRGLSNTEKGEFPPNVDVQNLKMELLVQKYAHAGLLESVVRTAIQHIDGAISRLKQNGDFSNRYGNLNIHNVLPIMIKESHLDNSRVSKTGAIGYFQLQPQAIEDAHKILVKLGIRKVYNPKDPIQNCILGIIFFENTEYRLKNETKNSAISLPFSLMAYNVGVGGVTDLIEAYTTENPSGNIPDWNTFAIWLAKKLEPNTEPKQEYSKEYNIQYKNYFRKDWTTDETVIQIGKRKIKKSKIQESINYVEKIHQINVKNNSTGKQASEPPISKVPETLKPIIAPLNKSVPKIYNKDLDAFQGEGALNRAFYNLKRGIGIHSNYMQIEANPGDSVRILLGKGGIPTTKENITAFLDINDLDSEVIKVNRVYLLPNIGKNEAPKTIEPAKVSVKPALIPKKIPSDSVQANEKERQSRNFYTWLNTIEVKNNSLKGKTFILDPGHGGGDPGAVPIVHRADGTPVPYRMSDITGPAGKEQVVKNGAGDSLLRVVEARVVMDIVYRIAKQLRENGAEVKITHYFQKGLDDSDIRETSQLSAPGLLDEIEDYDTWGDGSGDKFAERSVEGLHKRVRIRNTMIGKIKDPKSIYFVSIHADRMPGKDKKVGINILHEKGNIGQKSFAYLLATNIGTVRNEPATAGTREKGIYILNRSKGAPDQNVLIELGNMDNPNTAYALRNSKTRQDYADGIFHGLHTVAKKDIM